MITTRIKHHRVDKMINTGNINSMIFSTSQCLGDHLGDHQIIPDNQIKGSLLIYQQQTGPVSLTDNNFKSYANLSPAD